MKILLLEDNNRLNNSIVKRLEIKGYKVDSFIDGHEALNSIFDGYDCFILDINVPSIDGINILKVIRENDKNIPILIISSNIDLDTIKNAYGYGCNDYLKKPFFIDELEVKIEKLCQLDNEIISLDEQFTYDIKKLVIDLTVKKKIFLNLYV